MIQMNTLTAVLLSAAGLGLSAPPAMAAPTGSDAGDHVATASCIVRQLPQGARMFRASDGSMRVVSIGRRGNAAQWTITPAAGDVRVVRDRGMAGQERPIAGTCY